LKLTQLRSQARVAHGTQRGNVKRIRTGSRKRQTCVPAAVRHIPKARATKDNRSHWCEPGLSD
jgi:hypothetical protein